MTPKPPKQILLFDLENTPLEGTYLLEANAGTGKTFSLSGLFLKFLYFDETLSVKNIAAITFTKAATQEIFSRIKGDLEHFLNLITTHDTFTSLEEVEKFSFAYLLKDYYSRNETEKKLKCQHLKRSLLNFDEHNIHTIHGFSRKVVHEYQMELELFIEEALIQEDAPFFEDAFREFWRHHLLDVDPYFLAYFETIYPLKNWKNILFDLYSQPSLKTYPPTTPNPILDWENCPVRKKNNSIHEKINTIWEQLRQYIHPGIESKWIDLLDQKVLNQNKTKKLLTYWRTIQDLVTQGSIIPFLYTFFASWNSFIFSSKNVHSYFKKGFTPEDYLDEEMQIVIDSFDQLTAVLKMKPSYQNYAFLLIHASSDFTKKKSWEDRKNQGVLSFNDLIQILSDHVHSTAQGKYLVKEISQSIRVVLIDEFQDTDPLQFNIFRKLIPHLQATYFIADPKQSIYGFRQANIHTYFHAQKSMDKVFHLLSNYRSQPLLLEGINHLYTRHPSPFFIPELAYHSSTPGVVKEETKKSRSLKELGSGLGLGKPLEILLVESDQVRKIKDKQSEVTAILVKRIREEINRGEQVAILVRKRAQGLLIHHLLRNLGIPSQIEESNAIFTSQEANDLYLFMKALVACGETSPRPLYTHKDKRLLGALSTSLFLKEKIKQSSPYDDSDLLNWLLKFKNIYREWEKDGWYPMIFRFIKKEGIASCLLSQKDGDQSYLQLLQLIDIVQSWEEKLPENILQRFSHSLSLSQEGRAIKGIKGILASAEKIDQEVGVRISTIHKSKGLEYDIVHLPFLDENIFTLSPKPIFKLNSDEPGLNDNSDLAYDIGSDLYQEHQNFFKQESLAEELRILYVALTRAKKKCILYIAPEKKHYPQSLLAYLLHPPSIDMIKNSNSQMIWKYFEEMKTTGKDSNAIYHQRLSEWKKELQSLSEHPAISFEVISNKDDEENPKTSSTLPDYPAYISFQPALGVVYSERSQVSFTSIVSDITNLSQNQVTSNNLEPGDILEEQMDPTNLEEPNPSLPLTINAINDPLSTLPMGSNLGLFIHEALEKMDFSNSDSQYLKTILDASGNQYLGERYYSGEKKLHQKLIQLLQNIQELKLPFPGSPLPTLRDLLSNNGYNKSNKNVVKEMEFTLAFFNTEIELKKRLFHLLKNQKLLSQTELESKREDGIVFRKGFIKGFIDLVFRDGEKYYFIDWKSNYLGENSSHYEGDSLHHTMVEKNYYLQAYLYTLAIDRYLALCLGARGEVYDYEKHFGGFAYVFVRGLANGGILTHRPSSEEMVEMRNFLQRIT